MDTGRTTPQESITPDFEKRNGRIKTGSSGDGTHESAAEKLRDSEREATNNTENGGFYRPSRNGGVQGDGIKYTASEKPKSGKMKLFGKIPMPAIAVGLLLVLAALVVALLNPLLMLGQMSESFLNTFGFKGTVAILEEQAEHNVTGFLKRGKVPDGLAEDFLAYGMEVGQVTVAGEFVRTNTYIADLGNAVAATGDYVASGDGELAMRFHDKIIPADDFVVAVESDPEMYAAYSEALNMSSRYYYGDAVNEVYNNMGIKKGVFNSWKATGDSEADQESFETTLTQALDNESNRNVSGKYLDWYSICVSRDRETGECLSWTWEHNDVEWECSGSGVSWTCAKSVNGGEPYKEAIEGEPDEVAAALVGYVVNNSRDDSDPWLSAEENAAQILNTVLSADEPYRAAAAFTTLMEVLEMAKIGDNGPVNEMMTLLTKPQENTYVDVNTGQTVTEMKSVFDTYNFQIAAGRNAGYSKEEAWNASRDRILKATNTNSQASIENMPLSTNGKKKSGDGLDMKNDRYTCPTDNGTWCENNRRPDLEKLAAVIDAVKTGMVEKNSNVFSTTIGAERMLMGGSFVSNTLNQQVLGAMPSDAAQVANYQKEVDKVIARQAEAARATKSPFDISSEYTFMGNLVRKFSSLALASYGQRGGLSLAKVAGTLTKVTNDSALTMAGVASADGSDDDFVTLSGDCMVVPTSGATCDLYGTAHNTIYTGLMGRSEGEWAATVSEKKADDFLTEAMRRDATVGVESYDVCEISKKNNEKETSEQKENASEAEGNTENSEGENTEKDDTGSSIIDKAKGFFEKAIDFIKRLASVVVRATELEQGCEGVDGDVATGAKNVLRGGEENDAAELSAYALFSAVQAMLEEDAPDTAVSK